MVGNNPDKIKILYLVYDPYAFIWKTRTQGYFSILSIQFFFTTSNLFQSCPTLWDPMDYIAHQAPLSMGFSRQEYWSGLPFPSRRYLPDPGIELTSTCFSCIGGRFFTRWATWEAPKIFSKHYIVKQFSS